MENDLPGSVVPAGTVVAPTDRKSKKSICCEFCECELTPEGEVIKRGDAARKYLDLEDTIKNLRAQLTEAQKPAVVPTPAPEPRRRLWER